MKQHAHPIFGTMTLPTREFLNGEWTTVGANWIEYPDWRSCFADRLATLERLSNVYPHYKAALAAKTPADYNHRSFGHLVDRPATRGQSPEHL